MTPVYVSSHLKNPPNDDSDRYVTTTGSTSASSRVESYSGETNSDFTSGDITTDWSTQGYSNSGFGGDSNDTLQSKQSDKLPSETFLEQLRGQTIPIACRKSDTNTPQSPGVNTSSVTAGNKMAAPGQNRIEQNGGAAEAVVGQQPAPAMRSVHVSDSV